MINILIHSEVKLFQNLKHMTKHTSFDDFHEFHLQIRLYDNMTNSTSKSDRETHIEYFNNSARVIPTAEKAITNLEKSAPLKDSIVLIALIGFAILVGIILIWILTK